jgi:hypothetical protein
MCCCPHQPMYGLKPLQVVWEAMGGVGLQVSLQLGRSVPQLRYVDCDETLLPQYAWNQGCVARRCKQRAACNQAFNVKLTAQIVPNFSLLPKSLSCTQSECSAHAWRQNSDAEKAGNVWCRKQRLSRGRSTNSDRTRILTVKLRRHWPSHSQHGCWTQMLQ